MQHVSKQEGNTNCFLSPFLSAVASTLFRLDSNTNHSEPEWWKEEGNGGWGGGEDIVNAAGPCWFYCQLQFNQQEPRGCTLTAADDAIQSRNIIRYERHDRKTHQVTWVRYKGITSVTSWNPLKQSYEIYSFFEIFRIKSSKMCPESRLQVLLFKYNSEVLLLWVFPPFPASHFYFTTFWRETFYCSIFW